MRTEELIRAMATDAAPIGRARPWPMAGLLGLAVVGTALLVAAVALPALGMRADFPGALGRWQVFLKQLAPGLIALGAGGAVLRLARPGDRVAGWGLVLAAAAALLALGALATLRALPAAAWRASLMGDSAGACLVLVGLMALPFLAATLAVLRRGASTRPRLSGAMAGLLSGGAAATVYAFHCTEDSPLFLAAWYGLAILIVSAAGAWLGPRLLRW